MSRSGGTGTSAPAKIMPAFISSSRLTVQLAGALPLLVSVVWMFGEV